MASEVFLQDSFDPLVVTMSILVAALASYVTLDLTQRVRSPNRRAARRWWAAGSLVMGSGIWSMHFVGMMAFSLPIPIGYVASTTAVSWIAAVLVAGIALAIAGFADLTPHRLVAGALAMGAGICAMHYTGMLALDMAPGIVWDRRLVVASAAIAVAASAAALLIFFGLSRLRGSRARAYQLVAALVMGTAISGMHYTGMAAAQFPTGSVCLSADGLGGASLGTLVTLTTSVILVLTLVTSILDGRLQRERQRFSGSLEEANSQLQSANDELRRRAFSDPLTGLPNRMLFEDRLAHAVSRSERAEEGVIDRRQDKLAVLFIDLDGFKPVNDSFGHAAGDAVLKSAAVRLRERARSSDTVARVGGDEFVLLMEDLGSFAACVALARRIVDDLALPYDVAGRQVQISASVGIAVYPDHGHGDKLVAHADAAMYEAKRLGGGNYAVFEPRMDADVKETLTLQHDLRTAIERGELALHYQPKVDGRSGQIHGVEALLRWTHPGRGAVPPGVFIPIAERFGMIGAIGNWVIEEACRQMAAWRLEGMRMRVAINLSVHQLRDEGLPARVARALQHYGIDASQLLCEITETVAMEDIKATQRAFASLAEHGVFLSIDDFGTGYSSLSYLRQLPAKQLKIDRAFVKDLESSIDARAIVDAVVRLAHALGLRVVAEGVETAAQRDLLVALDCDELQGYFFARPMTATALQHWAMGDSPEGAADFSPSVLLSLAHVDRLPIDGSNER